MYLCIAVYVGFLWVFECIPGIKKIILMARYILLKTFSLGSGLGAPRRNYLEEMLCKLTR